MGKPRDPAYFRKYRAAHPEYAARDRARNRVRKAKRSRGDRSAEYAKRNAQRSKPVHEPLPQLYPELNSGKAIAFWEDELRMDLAQERALAELEGRDPDRAAAEYRGREINWFRHTVPISPLGRGQEELHGSGPMAW